jgi:hypothetical protein
MLDREVLSEMLEVTIQHLAWSPDDALKDFVAECYDEIYGKTDEKTQKRVMHKSRLSELDYIRKLVGKDLRDAILERYLRGYESCRVVGGKRLREVDVSMMKTKGKPRKRSHK